MKKPKISVIIPTYNCADCIEDAIKSVLAQTCQDFEIIVVDDGSTDDTRKILERYKDVIKYIYQENKKLPIARNVGIRAATGEFLAFLDSDDELVPEALATCLNRLENDGTAWCFTDLIRIEDNRGELRCSLFSGEDIQYEILVRDFIKVAFFIRKDTLENIGGYDEAMQIREDWDLKIRLIRSSATFSYINEPLYKYKIRKKSLTKKNLRNVLFFTGQLLKKHHKTLADAGDKKASLIYAENMWVLGRDYFYELKNPGRAFFCLIESLKYGICIGKLARVLLRHILVRG